MNIDGRPAHHTRNGFKNPPGAKNRKLLNRDYFHFIMRRARQSRVMPEIPEGHCLHEHEALRHFEAHEGADSLTWLGHACFLIRLGGKTIITDPYLSDYASPIKGAGPKRFVAPGISLENLPPIDMVVLSHNHYDHLDGDVIRRLPNKERITVVAPLGLKRFFTKRGYEDVHELDWHHSVEQDELKITALPAFHWSKRNPFDRNRTLWASFAIRSGEHNLYFAGDTGYGQLFSELGYGYGPFDTALVGIGAYAPRHFMAPHHTSPEEAVQIGVDLRADTIVAMHWGTLVLTDEPVFEPPELFRSAARQAGIPDEKAWIMKIGESRALKAASALDAAPALKQASG